MIYYIHRHSDRIMLNFLFCVTAPNFPPLCLEWIQAECKSNFGKLKKIEKRIQNLTHGTELLGSLHEAKDLAAKNIIAFNYQGRRNERMYKRAILYRGAFCWLNAHESSEISDQAAHLLRSILNISQEPCVEALVYHLLNRYLTADRKQEQANVWADQFKNIQSPHGLLAIALLWSISNKEEAAYALVSRIRKSESVGLLNEYQRGKMFEVEGHYCFKKAEDSSDKLFHPLVRYQQARRAFQSAINLGVRSAHKWIGEVHFRLQDHERAQKALSEYEKYLTEGVCPEKQCLNVQCYCGITELFAYSAPQSSKSASFCVGKTIIIEPLSAEDLALNFRMEKARLEEDFVQAIDITNQMSDTLRRLYLKRGLLWLVAEKRKLETAMKALDEYISISTRLFERGFPSLAYDIGMAYILQADLLVKAELDASPEEQNAGQYDHLVMTTIRTASAKLDALQTLPDKAKLYSDQMLLSLVQSLRKYSAYKWEIPTELNPESPKDYALLQAMNYIAFGIEAGYPLESRNIIRGTGPTVGGSLEEQGFARNLLMHVLRKSLVTDSDLRTHEALGAESEAEKETDIVTTPPHPKVGPQLAEHIAPLDGFSLSRQKRQAKDAQQEEDEKIRQKTNAGLRDHVLTERLEKFCPVIHYQPFSQQGTQVLTLADVKEIPAAVYHAIQSVYQHEKMKWDEFNALIIQLGGTCERNHSGSWHYVLPHLNHPTQKAKRTMHDPIHNTGEWICFSNAMHRDATINLLLCAGYMLEALKPQELRAN